MAKRVARAKAWTGGRGPDLVLDCSGHPDTFVEALKIVRVGGVVVEFGAFVDMGPVSINPNADICTKMSPLSASAARPPPPISGRYG